MFELGITIAVICVLISIRLVDILIDINTILKIKAIEFEIETKIREHFESMKFKNLIHDYKLGSIENDVLDVRIQPRTSLKYIEVKFGTNLNTDIIKEIN